MSHDHAPGDDGYRKLFDTQQFDIEPVVPTYVEDLKRRVSVARIDDKLYAFDDLCTHQQCPLSAGLLDGTTLMCQCHGSRFDVTTGAVLQGPATEPLSTYAVREVDGTIEAIIE